MNTWNELEPLPAATTWLLEASAGTGKTYQIASLFLRLVAEEGLEVDRILAITFTNAATAELRNRIRERLRDALEHFRTSPRPSTDDAVLKHLDARVEPSLLVKRLDVALRKFDLAPISTIHGFSKRMLQEFAFDSGQDSELELIADAGDLIEELVDDTLATLYAKATAVELELYAHAGMARANLIDVAKKVSGATRPAVRPDHVETAADQFARARDWVARCHALHRDWTSTAGLKARAAMLDDAEPTRLRGYGGEGTLKWLKAAEAWALAGAVKLPMDKREPLPWFRRLRLDTLREHWQDATTAIESRPWWPLVNGFAELVAARNAFWSSFAPVAAFARGARDRVEAQLVRRRSLTFDGMLSRLAERVKADGCAPDGIAARIRHRYDAVFVDEFQDTDDAQWQVVEAAFHGHGRLFLIGDPKQAIYAFRGANVHVYLKAAGVVDPPQRCTMANNWRSDPTAVKAMNELFLEGSRAFDEEAFDYVKVEGRKPVRTSPEAPGLTVRWIDKRVLGGAEGEPIGKKITSLAAKFAAREAAAWLNGERGQIRTEEGTPRDVVPADLAVLVNDRHEGEAVRKALARAGIPSVAAAKDSVFQSDAAGWIASWLQAVAGAGRDRDARTAVVSPLFGWRADELAWALAVADRGDEAVAEAERAGVGLEDRDWNAWTNRLRAAAERWVKHGFARTFDRELTEGHALPRVLALPNGERLATDLRHLFELLHVEDRTHRPGPAALAMWLRAQAGEKDDETAQRLESDARAVRIETIHVSKGLEYPVVLLPFGWAARKEKDDGGPLVLHGPSGVRLDVHTTEAAERAGAFGEASLELKREALRKAYVALTRAKHATVAWYGPIGDGGATADATATGRLLLRDPTRKAYPSGTLPDFATPGAWESARARLDVLVDRSDGATTWQAEGPADTAPIVWNTPVTPPAKPRSAAWPEGRESVAGRWIVTSYSGLAKGATAPEHDEKLTPEPQPESDGDATAVAIETVPLVKPPLEPLAAPPRLTLGRGTEYGTLVHEVFELVDFRSGIGKDGRSAREIISDAARRVGLGGNEALIDELETLLPALLETPLGSTRSDRRLIGLPSDFDLRQLTAEHRLDELGFDLRLGDGTAWERDATAQPHQAGALGARLGCVDPRRVYDAILSAERACGAGIAPWFSWLRSRRDAGKALIGAITGILTGSIDLVFRTGSGPAARYFIADYKTNKIESAEPGHYAGAWLDWEMARTGYLLQSLIYTLALHRHLKSRLGGYDYDKHIGGYLYLFLRGMSGTATPRDGSTGRPLGIFADRWPRESVIALDAALCPAGRVVS